MCHGEDKRNKGRLEQGKACFGRRAILKDQKSIVFSLNNDQIGCLEFIRQRKRKVTSGIP